MLLLLDLFYLFLQGALNAFIHGTLWQNKAVKVLNIDLPVIIVICLSQNIDLPVIIVIYSSQNSK